MKGLMFMLLYADNSVKHRTPAQEYMSVADFSIILGDIAKGVIPTGSQMPYPLYSEEELRNMQQQDNTPPWENRPGIREYNGPLGPYFHSM